MLLSSFPPRGKPSAAAKSVGEAAPALPKPNPADANSHLPLFMTFPFLPSQSIRTQPHVLLLEPGMSYPGSLQGQPCSISSRSSFLHCTRTQVWKRRQSKLEPTSSWVLPSSTGSKLCSSKLPKMPLLQSNLVPCECLLFLHLAAAQMGPQGENTSWPIQEFLPILLKKCMWALKSC